MKVLLLSTAFSGLAQRVLAELEALDCEIEQHYDLCPERLIDQVESFQPDFIICPFLTQRIPQEVWATTPCLIVHPGIEGDRGPSSLDWAIAEGETEWGVTVLQADEAFDAGKVWGSERFPMRQASKTSLFKREVTEATVRILRRILALVDRGLDPCQHHIATPDSRRGRERPLMRKSERMINWNSITTADALKRLRAADSRPGVRAYINGVEVAMFGGVEEPHLRGTPGEILSIHDGAFCCATKDGAVWVRQLKCFNRPDVAEVKLPATQVLQHICQPGQLQVLKKPEDTRAIDDISVWREGHVAFVRFNFYNGAMNVAQCLALKHAISQIRASDARMLVLLGGDDFFSNGIHLNCIEAAPDPAQASWQNINAMNDLVLEILSCDRQITVGALRNNAGAGGVILGLACDEVIVREGVVLNPHYKSMGLYGSEYWTYLLPRRVGQTLAQTFTEGCQPLLAKKAVEHGLADRMMEENWDRFHMQLRDHCQSTLERTDIAEFLEKKRQLREQDEECKPLAEYRREELAKMREIFFNPNSDYHRLRRNFVYKLKASPLPEAQVEQAVSA